MNGYNEMNKSKIEIISGLFTHTAILPSEIACVNLHSFLPIICQHPSQYWVFFQKTPRNLIWFWGNLLPQSVFSFVCIILMTSKLEHLSCLAVSSSSLNCCFCPLYLKTTVNILALGLICWSIIMSGSWGCVESSWIRPLNESLVQQ